MFGAATPNGRSADYASENAYLRMLIKEAGLDNERAFALMAEADAQHEAEIAQSRAALQAASALIAGLRRETERNGADRIHELEQHNARLVAKNEEQRLLMAELGHRVKNTLTLVQAMVSQTLREAASVEQARDALTSRVAALGAAQGMLIEECWSGAGLMKVAEAALAPHGRSDQPERFEISGPAVRLGPRQTLAVSMALHELGTNAVKYGALSNGTGRVEVVWRTMRRSGERWLHLRWCERAGPPVVPPSRRGFGSKLIERTMRDALGGEVTLDFLPDCLICTIEVHLQPNL